MENSKDKFKKSKEKIRLQIQNSLIVYEEKKEFVFFNSSSLETKLVDIELDDNELGVLLMNLNKESWILVTTKALLIRERGLTKKVYGQDMEKFEFLNLRSRKEKAKSDEFRSLRDFKSWLYSGEFLITTYNGTRVTVNLTHHDFGFCLFNAIKKLKFVTNKYDGI